MPLVSAIVPLYNKAPYVRRALDSIARQTFQDFEVIVVDDGSTDGGDAIAADYPDRRFKLIRQPNRGPGAARNRGIAAAQGELIASLDADDEWMPTYLEGAMADLREAPTAAAVACSYCLYPAAKSTEPLWRSRGLKEGLCRVDPQTDPKHLMHLLAFLTPCTTVVRSETVRRWEGYCEEDGCDYGEDAFLWLKVLLNEPVVLRLEPRVRIHSEAAALSKNLRGPRSLEPFLERPGAIESCCPEEYQPLLRDLLAARAFKTACVWGLWGKWREAKELRQRFRAPGDRHLPYYWPSVFCASRFGGAVGVVFRRAGLVR